MKINNASAKIDVDHTGVVPGFNHDRGRVTFHLTSGYMFQNNTETITPAVTFKGSVRIATANATEFSKWRFGFLQVHTLNTLSFFYAGPRKAPGRIRIEVNKPPALSMRTHLDSDAAFSPWTNAKRGTVKLGVVTAKSGDHPASRAKATLTNNTTGKTNFLFHVIDDRKLVTALAAEDPSGNFQIIAHVVWSFRYDFQFVWRSGKPKLHKNASRFLAGKSTLGMPSDPAAAGILALPTPPHANDEVRRAILHAVVNKGPNRSDLAGNFPRLPPNFVK